MRLYASQKFVPLGCMLALLETLSSYYDVMAYKQQQES